MVPHSSKQNITYNDYLIILSHFHVEQALNAIQFQLQLQPLRKFAL